MGLKLQVRGVTSAMPMNCAAAVTMADGALQPACGCLISRILHHCAALHEMVPTALAEVSVPAPPRQPREVSTTQTRLMPLMRNIHRYMGLPPVPYHCSSQASQQLLHQKINHGR